METFFLGCLLFGALFTIASVVLGFVSSHAGGADGAGGHDLALDAGGHDLALDAGGHGTDLPAHLDAGGGEAAVAHHGSPLKLPIFNLSSGLAFLTWFGAAGYVLLKFAAWPVLLAFPGAVVAGTAGGTLIALFLRKVQEGEQTLNPRDYRLEGTLARVTVRIPAQAVGEIVFTLADSRRSEAARSVSGQPIPRETEVVIIAYERGIATVQPWEEFIAGSRQQSLEPGSPPPPTSV